MEKPDLIAQRVRRCHHCGGDMTCKVLTQWKQNGANAGRDYLFVCGGCRKTVTELSASRAFITWFRIVLFGALALMMVGFGVKILLRTIERGFGGNDKSAIIMVLALFLGIGLPFLGAMLWWARAAWRDRAELKLNPVVR